MKFDFQNSTYSKLWNSVEGSTILRMLLQNPDLIRSNHTFWKEKFTIDPNVTPQASDGTATFKSEMRPLQSSSMMHMRAPLGDTVQRDKQGVKFYTGVIPDFISDGYREQAMEREYKEQQFQQFGSDALLIMQYAEDVQSRLDSANQTLSNMAAQIMSKGHIYYNAGQGIQGAVYKADIPAANFVKGGTKAWTDPECNLLDQMRDLEKKFKEDTWGVDIALQWEIPYDMWHNVFLKNKQVREWTLENRKLNKEVVISDMVVTETMVRQYLSQFEGLSPIVVIEEKQSNEGTTIHGWSQNIAVLRPQGYAGVIRHTTILDERLYSKYGSKLIDRVFASSLDGLVTVENLKIDNGNLCEWQMHAMMSAIPSLDEFLYHVIVDTTQADE